MAMVCEVCRRRHPVEALVCRHDGALLVPDPLLGTEVLDHRVVALLRPHPLGGLYAAKATDGTVRTVAWYDRLDADADVDRWLIDTARLATLRARPDLPTPRAWARGSEHGGPVPSAVVVLDAVPEARLAGVRRLPFERAVDLARGVAEALAAAHASGVVHGGLTPAAIHVGTGDAVHLEDFGLRRLGRADDEEEPAGACLAPEDDAHQPTAAGDVYALGVVLTRLVTGENPFLVAFSPAATRARHREHEAPRLDGAPTFAPEALADLVAAMLSKTPTERPEATEVARRLAAILRPGPTGPTEDRLAHGEVPLVAGDGAALTARSSVVVASPLDPPDAAVLAQAEAEGVAAAQAPPGALGRQFPQNGDAPTGEHALAERPTTERMLFGRGFTAEAMTPALLADRPTDPGLSPRLTLELPEAGPPLVAAVPGQGLVAAMVAGGVLTLLLVAGTVAWLVSRNTLPPVPTPPSSASRLDPNAAIVRVSGTPGPDQLGLEAAIERAREGQIIRLAAGTYRPVILRTSVILEADPDTDAPPVIEGDLPPITVDGGEVTVRGIHLRHTGTAGHAAQVNDGHLILEAVDITSVHGNGVRARASAQLTIRDTTIHDTGKGAVWAFERAKVVIDRATFARARRAAIEVTGDAEVSVRRTLIQDGEGAGVFLSERARGTISDNEITGNRLAGIEIGERATARIARNRLQQNRGSGIFVRGEAVEVRITDNEIHHNELAGVEVKGNATPEVWFNQIHDGKGSGIFVHGGARGIYARNQVDGQGLSGFEVRGAGSRAVAVGNTIRDGKRAGIYVHQEAEAILVDNEVAANARAGIEVGVKASIEARGNAVRTNRQAGVFFHDGGTGDLAQNDIEANAYSGIEIRDRAEPTLTANHIRRNRSHGIYLHAGGRGIARDNVVSGNGGSPYMVAEDEGTRLDWRENQTSDPPAVP